MRDGCEVPQSHNLEGGDLMANQCALSMIRKLMRETEIQQSNLEGRICKMQDAMTLVSDYLRSGRVPTPRELKLADMLDTARTGREFIDGVVA